MANESLIGIVPMNNYAAAANDQAAVDLLIALIPDPDTTSSSGAQSGGGRAGTMLDEMSPIAAIQLRVELLALRAAVGTTNTL